MNYKVTYMSNKCGIKAGLQSVIMVRKPYYVTSFRIHVRTDTMLNASVYFLP